MITEARKYSFYVDGIRCMGCVSNIETALRKLDCVESADVHLGRKMLQLKLTKDSKFFGVDKEIRKLGFRLVPANGESVSVITKQSSRRSMKQLAIAGAFAGNIMMFAIPIYAGLEGELRRSFEWISFLLFLPILGYSALPFYRGAWASIKSKQLSIDLPITVALTLTSIMSIIHLVRGTGEIYFDSTASFVFLILATRYFNERARIEKLSPVNLKELLSQKSVSIKTESGDAEVPAEDLVAGDLVQFRAGEILSFDGINKTESAAFDTSFVNGESLPRIFAAGAQLSSGYRAIENCDIQVERPVNQSRLSDFIEKLNQTLLSESSSVRQMDRLSHLLIGVICITSIAVALLGFWFGWSEMIRRATALLVIACPCALAFAAPLTLGSFLKKALRKKIFIRDANVFEDILECKNIVLDKTGTLTTGRLELVSVTPAYLSDELKGLILSLEKISDHPVAFALREAWKDVTPRYELESLKERLGRGVSGIIKPNLFEIETQTGTKDEKRLSVVLKKNGVPSATLYFRDALRQDTQSCIEFLRKENKKIHLLSGDAKLRVLDVAQTLEISKTDAIGEADPESKSKIIESLQPAIMVGDGINDALALAKAKVGIAVRGNFEGVLSSARVFIPRQGLSGVIDLFQMSHACKKTLNRNFTLALAYNGIGALLAIFGFVNPLVAAIAMPLSSVILLLSTLWGTR